jgi:hypothetical protein
MRKRVCRSERHVFPFLAALLVVGATSLAAGPALAKDPSKEEITLAKDMVKEAQGEAKAGRCEDAIQILKQAIAIHETAEALLVLGDCQAKGGALKDAVASFKRGAEVADPKKDKARLEALQSKKADAEGRIPKLTIELPAGVSGAVVKLDGKELAEGKIGEAIPLDPGQHEVEASAPGRTTFSKKIELGEKEAATIAVELAGGTTEEKKPVVAAGRSGPPRST